MTEDRTADWHAQFAPAPTDASGVETITTERLGTVEHFAGDDGVFAAPVPGEAEPAPVEAAESPAEDAPKGKGKRGEAESAA